MWGWWGIISSFCVVLFNSVWCERHSIIESMGEWVGKDRDENILLTWLWRKVRNLNTMITLISIWSSKFIMQKIIIVIIVEFAEDMYVRVGSYCQ